MTHTVTVNTLTKGKIEAVEKIIVKRHRIITPDGHNVEAWKDQKGNTYLASCGMCMTTGHIGMKYIEIDTIKEI